MLILGNCVVLVLLGSIACWAWFSRWRTRAALRWWEAHQMKRWHHQAENLRNGAIQDLFGLRRATEALALQPAPVDESAAGDRKQPLLTIVQQLHATLEETGDSLSVPFAEDDFLLALRHVILNQFQTESGIQAKLAFPSQWREEPIEQVRLILATSQTLLELMSPMPDETKMEAGLDLDPSGKRAELKFRAVYPREHIPQPFEGAAHLKQSFWALTGGSCTYRYEGHSVQWCLSWPSSSLV